MATAQKEYAVARTGKVFAIIRDAAERGEPCPPDSALAEAAGCEPDEIADALSFLEANGMIKAARVVTIRASGKSTAHGFPPANFCTHCGANLEADRPVEVDGWRVTLVGLRHEGREHRLPPAKACIVHSLASARGGVVSGTALSERAGIDSDRSALAVHISQIRKRVPGIPIENVQGAGYRWRVSLAEAA